MQVDLSRYHTSNRTYALVFLLRLVLRFKRFLPSKTSSRMLKSLAKRDPLIVFGDNERPATRQDLEKVNYDIKTILESKNFNPEFCHGIQSNKLSRLLSAQKYVKQFRSQLDVRKPEPGFNPNVFLEQAEPKVKIGIDPYAEFLRRGRPIGPWIKQVIYGGMGPPTNKDINKLNIALHIHAFYLEQFKYILDCLLLNSINPDLYISAGYNADLAVINHVLSIYPGEVKSITKFPNAGRDIGPFLTGFRNELSNNYDIIGHVHTKKSPHIKDSRWAENWFNFCISNLIGSYNSISMIDCIVAEMHKDPHLGVVYPEDPHLPGWGPSLDEAIKLASGINNQALPIAIDFPVGSMFWARAGALKPFFDQELDWSDYPSEPLPSDGTMLHALERLFGVIPLSNGWRTAVTHTENVFR